MASILVELEFGVKARISEEGENQQEQLTYGMLQTKLHCVQYGTVVDCVITPKLN